MASAVINSTGDVYYSKVTDSSVTPANNILDNTSAIDNVAASTDSDEWISSDDSGGTDADKIIMTAFTVAASEAGPAKGVTCVKAAIGSSVNIVGTTTPFKLCHVKLGTTVDISGYDALTFYIRTDTAIAASTLQLWVSSATDGTAGTAIEKLTLPAIPKTTLTADAASDTAADVDKWVRVVLKFNASTNFTGSNKVGSLALYWIGAEVNTTQILYFYQFRLLKSFPGRTGFSISETIDTVDVSDYQSLTAKEFATTYSSWTCSIDGHKEGAPPIDKGKEYVLGIWESDTVGQCFVGNAFYTSFTPSGTFNESVKYSYAFQGTSFLSKPLA